MAHLFTVNTVQKDNGARKNFVLSARGALHSSDRLPCMRHPVDMPLART